MEYNPFSLKGKRIIITGASSGIGKETAIACSKMEADLILLARDNNRLQNVYKELKPGNHLFHSIDLVQYDKIEACISGLLKDGEKIDGFVHAAGIEMTIPLQLMKSKLYEEIFAINVISGFEIAKILSKQKYINKNSAAFVFISSIMGLLGEIGKIGYCSSKGALISGVRTMALELAAKKIKVNCISPAIVETEMVRNLFSGIPEESQNTIRNMHPFGFGKPEDIANACIYLLSDASRWITGSNLIIDGGYSIK